MALERESWSAPWVFRIPYRSFLLSGVSWVMRRISPLLNRCLTRSASVRSSIIRTYDSPQLRPNGSHTTPTNSTLQLPFFRETSGIFPRVRVTALRGEDSQSTTLFVNVNPISYLRRRPKGHYIHEQSSECFCRLEGVSYYGGP